MKEELEGFARDTIESLSDLENHQRNGWIFRGHSDAGYLLETTFDRCCHRHHVERTMRAAVERELLREFRRAYHLYAPHVPDRAATIEWLSLMQHYGAPTRLLDFSYSIYVAAYFAVKTTEKDAAVWALNSKWAFDSTLDAFRACDKPTELITAVQEETTEASEEAQARLLTDDPIVRAILPVNAFRLNERLLVQKGVFAAATAVNGCFMENIRGLPDSGDSQHMIRLIIPAKAVDRIRKGLYDMNITARSLFPGLGGYASALGVHHPIFDPDSGVYKKARKS